MEGQTFELTLTGGEGYRFTVDFDMDGVAPLLVDEPPPLGEGAGPNPSRLLVAAIADCLSASLMFCLKKARIEPAGFRTTVEGELVRNERNRLRMGPVKVRLEPSLTAEDQLRMGRCLGLFEDFCVVTESVRNGIEVEVEVVPTTVDGGEVEEPLGASASP